MDENFVKMYADAVGYTAKQLIDVLADIKETYEEHHLAQGQFAVDVKLLLNRFYRGNFSVQNGCYTTFTITVQLCNKEPEVEVVSRIPFSVESAIKIDLRYHITILSSSFSAFVDASLDAFYVYTNLIKDYKNEYALEQAKESIRDGIGKLSTRIDTVIKDELLKHYWISQIRTTVLSDAKGVAV